MADLVIGMGDDTYANRDLTFLASIGHCGYKDHVCIIREDPLPWHPVVDRWKLIADYIKAGSFDRVIACDTFDVVFQEDPFPRLKAMLEEHDHELVLTSEERLFRDCEANKRGMMDAFPQFWEKVENKPILNAGVIAGKAARVAALCEDIYNLCQQDARLPKFTPGFQDRLPDQQALNILAPADATIVEGKDAWAFQYNHAHEMRDGIMYNANGQRYAILHQYLYQWKEEVQRRYT